MKKNILSIILVCLWISGCASTYTGPIPGTPTADVTFKVSGAPFLGYLASLWVYDKPKGKTCSGERVRLAYINKGNPFGGSSDNPPRISIPAGKEINISASLTPANAMGQYGCRQDNVFYPAVNGHYLIKIDWTSSLCTVQLLDITKGEDKAAKHPRKEC